MDGILAAAESRGKHISMDWSSGWYTYSFFGNTGLTLGLNDDGLTNFCDWNSTENAIKGTDVAKGMLNISASSAFINGGDDVLLAGAADDSVIAGVSGVWAITSLEELWGSNLAAAKLPTYTVAGQQVQMSSFAGYKLVGVNSYSDNQEWAAAFAEYLTGEECQTLRFEMRGQGPSNIAAAASDAVEASVGIQGFLAQSDYSTLQRIGGNFWTPTSDFGNKMAAGNPGGEDLQTLMDEMVAGITAAN